MAGNQGKILVVDDESSIRRALLTTLGVLGFDVSEASNGERAVDLAGVEAFDAVLLDINMPGMGGVAACRALREAHPQLAILMLTVRNGQEDKVQALDAGADDYIAKPFQLSELAARLRAAVRRSRSRQALQGASAPVIRIGDLELSVERRQLLKAGQPVRLTPKEFDLLRYLMSHAGIPVPHARLLQAVWGLEYGSEVEYLRTFVRQLRKKIGDDAAEPQYLKTDPYVGYRFRDLTE
jgi:two-component system KDP operon response regulator KdpE